MNEIIDIETLFSDKTYCCNLGNIILNVKFNIADCIEEAFNEIKDIVKKPLGTVLWIYNKSLKKVRKELNYEKD